MKHFFKSLAYLKPYRVRIGISIFCVILITLLYGGGLAMLLPGMKILISEEGLHGWVWNKVSEDCIEAKTLDTTMPPSLRKSLNLNLDTEYKVATVLKIYKDSPLAKSGIKPGEQIFGIASQAGKLDPTKKWAVREISLAKPGTAVNLAVYNTKTAKLRTEKVTLDSPGLESQGLLYIGKTVPEVEKKSDRYPVLVWLLIAAGILTILRNFFRFFQEYLVQTAIFLGLVDLRSDCYNVALRLPVEYYSEKGTTDTMSRFISDIDELGGAQITLFGKTMVEPAKAIGSIVVALYFSTELTLYAMLGGPVVYVLIRKLGKVMKRASKRALESRSNMLAILEETLVGIRVVKAYTMEASERKRFFRTNRELYAQQKKISAINSSTSPSVEALGMIAGGFAAAGAGHMMFRGEMDSETFLAWMAALAAMFDPMRKLSKVATKFHRGDAAAKRVFELRDAEQEKRTPGAKNLPKHKKAVEFKSVTYQYPNTKTPAVDHVSLSVKAGQSVAIVGPNGCGKTTFLSLLPRLLVPKDGKIVIDGFDTAKTSLRSLRRQISVVTQETIIFNASIAENISYGLRSTTREAVIEAAKKAHVDEFVTALPDGYDTVVGQRGSTLSGGQRQRIAIARAILRDPSILIFDEALSQVDPHSEKLISDAMGDFMKNRTTFMIAHRFQTILSSDIIAVMNAGKIVDQGTHDQLLKSCDLYQHLYKTQFNNK